MSDKLTVSSSPHLRHPDTTTGIMGFVIMTLAPAVIYGCLLFGWRAIVILVTCIGTAVLSEFLWNKLLHKPNTIGDLSAVVTGLLLGMNLSSKTPFWMAAVGSFVAIIIVKQLFGGIGHNFVNPAMAARIVLLVSFPGVMTTYLEPVSNIVTSATPLAGSGTSVWGLFFGLHSGTIGETPAFLLLVGGLFLVIFRVISPAIPLCFIGTVGLLTLVSGDDPLRAVFSGGLMLGAIFMATDYTTSPVTLKGKIVFGIGCGLITFVIRKFGSLPEGVSYAIIIMNILTPHINRFTQGKTLRRFRAPQREEMNMKNILEKIITFLKKNKDDIVKPVLVLLAICIVIPLALAVTNKVTVGRIAALEEKNQSETMARLIKADNYHAEKLSSDDGEVTYYIAETDKQATGYIFITKGKGYGGEVSVMTAITPDGTVKSVAILDVSNETPGLGQNANNESFYGQFKDKKKGISILKNGADAAKNEVNAVTGATITSKAVTGAVNEALSLYETAISGQGGSQS